MSRSRASSGSGPGVFPVSVMSSLPGNGMKDENIAHFPARLPAGRSAPKQNVVIAVSIAIEERLLNNSICGSGKTPPPLSSP